MINDFGRRERKYGDLDMPWAHTYAQLPITRHYPQPLPPPPPATHMELQPRRSSRTSTSRSTSRTAVERPTFTERPVSSGGEPLLPFRSRRCDSYHHTTPQEDLRNTRKWPPRGCSQRTVMNPEEAEEEVCTGANIFKGYWDDVPNAPEGHVRFYAVMVDEHVGRTDRASFHHDAFADVSLDITGAAESTFPWVSLDQPCMAYCFGRSPGTTTLNYKIGKSGSPTYSFPCSSGVKPRKIKLLAILDRLMELEAGFEDEDPENLYQYLYGTLIDDPDRMDNPHYGMENQIADLIIILGSSDWIDFSHPKNQVVAKFFESQELEKKHRFFHQLLLSIELYLRIHSTTHFEKAKRKILLQLPPRIAWDLALAQRWLDNMSISRPRTSSKKSTFNFDLRSKDRQKEALRMFAKVLKWPNMQELEYILDETDKDEKAVEDRSHDAMSWFTGVVLPGNTLPWLLMNSVIDCDQDTGESLNYLTHMHPQSGFQYRANTYWSYQCIIGKVLGAARGVNQIAGWIGPCINTVDLKRSECARIRHLPSPDPRLTTKDVETMSIRTEPLGPSDNLYPMDDYDLPTPDTVDIPDTIRVEKLSLQPVKDQPSNRQGEGGPLTFDAAVIFAVGGDSWPMRLRYDVDFVAAFPCHQGPHVLFYDYTYESIKVDQGLVDRHDWAQESGRPMSRAPSPSDLYSRMQDLSITVARPTEPANKFVNKVLAIEALGVSDNEVFARAWCSHWGLSAIVANVKDTCMACAIREAYAACLSVVIFTQGGDPTEKDDEPVKPDDF